MKCCSCQRDPSYCCKCTTMGVLVCERHLLTHMSDASLPHQLSILYSKQEKDLLSVLKEELNKTIREVIAESNMKIICIKTEILELIKSTNELQRKLHMSYLKKTLNKKFFEAMI